MRSVCLFFCGARADALDLQSRNFLISPHSNPSDHICAEALTTAYHALLLSVLTTWQPKQNALNAQGLVAFIQSVLLALPSSSSARAGPPVQNIVFGEILVDVLWSTDAQLDEFLADAKSALVSSEQAPGGQQVKDTPKKDTTDSAEHAARLRHFVEQDKETLSELVKRLLVSTSTRFYSILNLSTNSSLASLISLYAESVLT